MSAVCLLLPCVGHAADAPAGNSAVHQFVESLPDGSGLQTTNAIANVRDAALAEGRVVDRRTRRALERRRGGEAIISLAEASGPQPSPRAPRAGSAGDGQGPAGAAVERLVGGSGPAGLGLVLPLVLLAGLLSALGYGLRRAVRT